MTASDDKIVSSFELWYTQVTYMKDDNEHHFYVHIPEMKLGKQTHAVWTHSLDPFILFLKLDMDPYWMYGYSL